MILPQKTSESSTSERANAVGTRVGERESPETEVGGGVGHAAETELDGLDALEDEELGETGGLLFLVGQGGVAHELRLGRVVGMALVLDVENEGLEEEHPGNGDDHGEKKVELDFVLGGEETRLLFDDAGVQSEVDQHVDELRGVAMLRHARIPVLEREQRKRDGYDEPLHDDHHDHPSEEGEQVDHLGNGFAEEIHPLVMIEHVHELQTHSQNHLRHAEDHREFHLKRVVEQQGVRLVVPHRVQTERIHAARPHAGHGGALELPRGAEPVHAQRELVVVEESHVHGVHSHQNQHAAAREDHADHLVHAVLLQLLREVQKVDCRQRDEDGCGSRPAFAPTMSKIAEHHSELEGEGDQREHSGVALLVGGHAVRIHHRLRDRGEFVGVEVRGRLGPRLAHHVEIPCRLLSAMHIGDHIANAIDGLAEDPSLAVHVPTRHRAELVEHVVHRFLLLDRPLPGLDVLRHIAKQAFTLVDVQVQHALRVLQLRNHLLVRRTHLCGQREVDVVDVALERVDDSTHFAFDQRGTEEQKEGRHVHVFSCLCIRQRRVYASKADEAVAARGSEQHSLEGELVFVLQDTRNVPKSDRTSFLYRPTRFSSLPKLVYVSWG